MAYSEFFENTPFNITASIITANIIVNSIYNLDDIIVDSTLVVARYNLSTNKKYATTTATRVDINTPPAAISLAAFALSSYLSVIRSTIYSTVEFIISANITNPIVRQRHANSVFVKSKKRLAIRTNNPII
ncbi:hypothetical protein D3C76_1143370 [compost metagenome]